MFLLLSVNVWRFTMLRNFRGIVKMAVSPDKFRPGQVVQLGISFRLLLAGERRKFLLGLDAIMIENTMGINVRSFI